MLNITSNFGEQEQNQSLSAREVELTDGELEAIFGASSGHSGSGGGGHYGGGHYGGWGHHGWWGHHGGWGYGPAFGGYYGYPYAEAAPVVLVGAPVTETVAAQPVAVQPTTTTPVVQAPVTVVP